MYVQEKYFKEIRLLGWLVQYGYIGALKAETAVKSCISSAVGSHGGLNTTTEADASPARNCLVDDDI